MKIRAFVPVLLLATIPASGVRAAEPVDWQMVNRIRHEGLNRSRVMETQRHLTDVIGPRLTGSPGMREANEWTRDRLAEWGLDDARVEPWGYFGHGWSFSRCSVHLLRPRETSLVALPQSWSPGTRGPVQGPAMRVTIDSVEDFDRYRGKLDGKILLMDEARELLAADKAELQRYSPEELDELELFPLKEPDREWRQKVLAKHKLRPALHEFLVGEGALATVEISSRDGGLVRLDHGGSRFPGESVGVPALVMAAEQYNWLMRLVEDERPVELEIEVRARFHEEDLQAYNTLAEIPGADRADELVMVGAHLDSHHQGAGANDNAAGVAVVMEAVRILRELEVRPRRTIRIALWSGEEEGLLGSQAYVERHFAAEPQAEDEKERRLPFYLRKQRWPLEIKPGHEKLSAYFNLDNGSGRIRGIYTQENVATQPIFEAWLEPFHDLGADRVTNRNTHSTDHVPFDRVGLPGFQFIQDGLDYMTRTHHTNMDLLDHTSEEDLKQASVVIASFLYHAAMREEMLPRKPMPTAPPEGEQEEGEEQEQEEPGEGS